MFTRRILAAGVAGALLIAGAVSANAADLVPTPVAPPPPPAALPAPAFSLAGAYFGVHGGVTFNDFFGGAGGAGFAKNFGAQGGYNLIFGPGVLAGVEVRTGLIWFPGGGGPNGPGGIDNGYADLNLHLGFARDRFGVYGIAGIGATAPGVVFYQNLGVGAEFLLSPDVSLFGQVMYSSQVGCIACSLGTVVQLGLNLH